MDALKNRAMKEYNDLVKNKKDHSVEVHLVNGDFRHWKGRIKGPIDTCYAGGVFDVDIIIPDAKNEIRHKNLAPQYKFSNRCDMFRYFKK